MLYNVHNTDIQGDFMQATERIQLRTTPQTKAMLEQASQQLGVSVSYFILDSAYRRAAQTIKETSQIILSADEWQRAIELLDAPSKPNHAMQGLFDRGFKRVDN